MDLLFSNADLGSDQRDQIITAMDAIVGEEEMMWEFNSHLFIDEYSIQLNGKEKIILAEWDPIIFNGVIEKVMITVRDITELKSLEREAEGKKRELEIISQVISIDQEKFVEFIQSAYKFLDENEQLISKNAKKNPEVLALLFRNMHTIKGNARTYGLSTITDKVHNAENTYSALRSDDSEAWDQARLSNELKSVETILEEYVDVCKNVLSRDIKNQDEERSYTIKSSELDNIFNLIQSLNEDQNLNEQSRIQANKVESIISSLNSVSFQDAIADTCSSLNSIALQLEKSEPKIEFSGGDIAINKESIGLLNNVFSHILRNSIDHGIESPQERTSKGKPEHGTISIDVQKLNKSLSIHIKDDGQGLNLQKLQEKGEEVGILKIGEIPSVSQLATLIFESGMSTKQEVSSISGRGVGMDAVKKFIEERGGSVTIKTESDINSGQFINFETVIVLPDSIL